MKHRTSSQVILHALIIAGCVQLCTNVSAVAKEIELVDAFEGNLRPILKSLCYECHGPKKEMGGIRFDRLDPDLVNGLDAEIWHDVLDQLNLGEMPPSDAERQPKPGERRVLTEWLDEALRAAADSERYKRGRVVTRRLTSYEYANTMRDLLGVDLDFGRNLPPEPASREGFLNNGATLEMSPTQVEAYLEAARKALAEAIVTGPAPEVHEYMQAETAQGKLPNRKVAGHEPVQPEFVLDLKTFPRHGPFELKVTARASVPEEQGLPRMRVSMGHVPGIVHVPRKLVGEVDVADGTESFVFHGRMEDYPQSGTVPFGNVAYKGMIVLIDFVDAEGKELRYPDRTYAQPPPPKKKPRRGKQNPAPDTPTAKKPEPVPFGERLEIEVTSVEFRAPVYASWPPPSHEQLLFPREDGQDEAGYVRALLRRFMSAAFRRPATDSEVERTAKLFEAIRPEAESFEETLRETFASVLVSPHFLYRVERREKSAEAQPVTDWELASRLSYFLWSSAPDAHLRELAGKGTLNNKAVLAVEVERLLGDPRGEEFTHRFADQWLDLDALNRVAINPEFFPDFDNTLKRHMRQETLAYLAKILREDRSMQELLDSDWAIVNRSLARHYGLEGPRSSRFEWVKLKPDDRPGGLLGQGAFLLANANGEDSHPIKRAVWILDRLLDSPPGSPPPDVPELDAESPDLAKLPLKEQLAVHRKKEACANCHQGLDPWGVPLEHFDAVGLWRKEVPAHKKRPASAIDDASVLPDGTAIHGIEQLQDYLVNDCRERFARSVVKRVMSYGLGRSLDLGDREAVTALTKDFMTNDFKLKPLIINFVQSESFRTK